MFYGMIHSNNLKFGKFLNKNFASPLMIITFFFLIILLLVEIS